MSYSNVFLTLPLILVPLCNQIFDSRSAKQVFSNFCPPLLKEKPDSLIIRQIIKYLFDDIPKLSRSELLSSIVSATNGDLGIALAGMRSKIANNQYASFKQLDNDGTAKKSRLQNILFNPEFTRLVLGRDSQEVPIIPGDITDVGFLDLSTKQP